MGALVQFRVDNDLKNQATKICEDIGLDLQSYLRMCLKQLVNQKGVPLIMHTISDEEIMDAIRNCNKHSKENGLDKMAMEEIDETIAECRKERRK
ncbi:MAG: type II toxin-antitoxin system RelB/DinJ family antitoxin [Bacilli bacterium]|nr:type II toxin-antitoxin system RelB/DinJ family antitoxin [Bacilli bacterium]